MDFYFLSHFINNETPEYGGGKEINISQRSSISNGDSSNSKMLKLPNHVGTHIDFPNHFSAEGKTINEYDADFWTFNSPFLLNYKAIAEELITLDGLVELIPETTDFLIIKTGFQECRGQKKYWNNNPGLAPELASILRKQCPHLKAVGFDFISLSSYQHREVGREAHKNFLVENEILIIEDMDLNSSNKQFNKVIILPLLIDKADGCPVTILAQHD